MLEYRHDLLGYKYNMISKITYSDAGVSIDKGDALVERIKPFAKKTLRDGVLAGIGGFGAMFEIAKKYNNPVLVSGTDGVGTKLKLAFELNLHNTIGIDLVAMSVNDILVQGAEPLFFLDYFACGKLDVDTATDVVKGITDGCIVSGCSLIGGETAEMPGMYADGEYDLAGFAVGVVDKDKIVDGSKLTEGDIIIGLESSGFHSNGYSLVRKLIKNSNLNLSDRFAPNVTWGEAILKPTQLYVKPVLDILAGCEVHGMSHITGGGITGNLPRIFPEHLSCEVSLSKLPKTNLFEWAQNISNLDNMQMLETFNCGIGFVVIVNQQSVNAVESICAKHGIKTYTLGQMIKQNRAKVNYLD